MINDRELERLFGIPHTTTRDWKKRKSDNWRYKLIHFLKAQEMDTIKMYLNELEKNQSENLKNNE